MFGTVRRIVRFWRVVQVLQVTGGMDSDTENDMVGVTGHVQMYNGGEWF